MKLSQAQNDKAVCIVTPYLPALSETFIRGHIERLPTKVFLVHSWPPSIGNRPVLSRAQRFAYKIQRAFTRSIEKETTAAYVAAFRRCGADAVLAEYGTTGVLTLAACRQLALPLIVHFHGYDASVYDVLKENAETYPLMFKEGAAIVVVSRAMERKLISLGAPPEKVHYNPYGIDCSEFGGADPSNAPPNFVAVGRFVEKKAPHLTLRAFAEVQRKFTEARLRMIGDGPLFDECRALARELHVETAVAFLGSQPPDVVRGELRNARCFVQHSVEAANGDCEGTPLGILEAQASGLPVVSTRHAGIADVVVEGETGFLVAEGDVHGMANAMATVLEEPQLAGRLGASARERIKLHFSEGLSLKRLMAIIESCIRGQPLDARDFSNVAESSSEAN